MRGLWALVDRSTQAREQPFDFVKVAALGLLDCNLGEVIAQDVPPVGGANGGIALAIGRSVGAQPGATAVKVIMRQEFFAKT